MDTIGKKIYKLRKAKGFSQERLGLEVGVSRQAISKWESDEMLPNTENIKQLCYVFNVSPNYFLSEQKLQINERAISETAVTENVEKPKRKTALIVFASINIVLTILVLIGTIFVGNLILSPNKGDLSASIIEVGLPDFIIVCIILCILIVVEIILLIFIFKGRKSKKQSLVDKK